ncbi:hypothetical protein AB4Y32_38570 [Paraburkholderia phymatum]|uniref:Uncharacterized protein n=1 Tax=Paraburkholderia phymatum TaxID=148447 RepID=A0ACC6UDR1_9BURK
MAYATDPAEETDKAELLKLASDKLRRPVEIPVLSRAATGMWAVDLVATVHGSAGPFFYDSADGTRMAVMIRPMIHKKQAPTMEQTAGDVGGVTWAARGLGYSVVGAEALHVLHPIAGEVCRQVRSKPST